jgi:hypothetical protein
MSVIGGSRDTLFRLPLQHSPALLDRLEGIV